MATTPLNKKPSKSFRKLVGAFMTIAHLFIAYLVVR